MFHLARRAALGTITADAALVGLGILTGALAARLLGPEGRGALAVVLFWPQLLATVGLWSLAEATTCRIGAAPEREATIATTALWLSLGLAMVTVLVGYACIPWLLEERRTHLWSLARVYLVSVPCGFVTLALLAADQGRLRFGRYNGVRLVPATVYALGVVWLWLSGLASVGALVAWNAAGSVAAALLGIAIHAPRLGVAPSGAEARRLLQLAGRLHPAALLLVLGTQVDRLVVLALWDDLVLGLYAAALTAASTGVGLFAGALPRVLFPYVARASTPGEQAELLARAFRQATVQLAILVSALWIAMPWLVAGLFGPAFEASVELARVLLVACALGALNTLLIQGLRGAARTWPGLVAETTRVATFLALAWPLGRAWGPVGVALAGAAANAGAIAYLASYLSRRLAVGSWESWPLASGGVVDEVGRVRHVPSSEVTIG